MMRGLDPVRSVVWIAIAVALCAFWFGIGYWAWG